MILISNASRGAARSLNRLGQLEKKLAVRRRRRAIYPAVHIQRDRLITARASGCMHSFSALDSQLAEQQHRIIIMAAISAPDHVSVWSGEKIIKSRANLSPFARHVHNKWRKMQMATQQSKSSGAMHFSRQTELI